MKINKFNFYRRSRFLSRVFSIIRFSISKIWRSKGRGKRWFWVSMIIILYLKCLISGHLKIEYWHQSVEILLRTKSVINNLWNKRIQYRRRKNMIGNIKPFLSNLSLMTWIAIAGSFINYSNTLSSVLRHRLWLRKVLKTCCTEYQ